MIETSGGNGAVPLFFPPSQLADFAGFFAAEVAAGKYPYVDYREDERWHQRIYRDRRMDVWLISWLPTQGTQLHDHGGSSGAFAVLSGTLDEASLTGSRDARAGADVGDRRRAQLVDRRRLTGERVSFGAHYVHDVRNLSQSPAVSVHVYSPPLTSMNFYDIDGGAVSRIATLATDDPEPEIQPASVAS